MSALTFDKSELGNLEYSLQREMLATDRKGGYMSTTIVCCNTRKYHGLMVAPIDQTDEAYVLLSSLDETIIQHDQSFNLALHRFKGVYEPRGHKYITDFEYTPTPTITYRVGGVILRKELLWIHKRTQLMIRYTLVDAHSDTTLRLRPFFAFRNKHSLSKANVEANGRSYPIAGGVKCKLYEGYPWLYLQTNKADAEFVAAPDWYYGFEYPEEIKRGYDGYEDLLTTGYFEMPIKKGESVIFSAATDEMATGETISQIYEASIARRTHKIDFLSCLHHSARQFVVRRPGGRTEMIAGYPWYGTVGRDTLISLPGIVLEQNYKEDCLDVLDTMVAQMKDGDFAGNASAWVAADAPLWFFWSLQNLEKHITAKKLWERYGEAMKSILEAYRRGFGEKVKLHDNGLVWAAAEGECLTWMNTIVDGKPVAQRAGYAVEIQALWYNAVSYTLALARKYKDKAFVEAWAAEPAKTKESFISKFWLDEGYLADYVNDYETNDYRRSNMLVACGLDYTMLSEEQMMDVLSVVRQHLITPRGVRSLSPRNPHYEPSYAEDQRSQDLASRNGSIWVWPLMFYAKSCFAIAGEGFLPNAEELLAGFDSEIQTSCIGSISECFEGDPPFRARGCLSQATSVGALLYIHSLVQQWREKTGKAAPAKKAAPKKSAAKKATVEAEVVAEAQPKKKCVRKKK
ncbi:MAG: glycogen debranching enzyme family protein [Alistipes sp.]|nr:glycogen debranching enzyme family protein [Alistipes sp.]MBR3793136.1 glycogen debranching enzyme family protein [Alistipes sp.]